MKKILLFVLPLLTITLNSCSKNGEETQPAKIDLTYEEVVGIYYFETNFPDERPNAIESFKVTPDHAFYYQKNGKTYETNIQSVEIGDYNIRLEGVNNNDNYYMRAELEYRVDPTDKKITYIKGICLIYSKSPILGEYIVRTVAWTEMRKNHW